MVMVWSSSFEAYPSGSDFASVTAKAIREAKTGVREYLEKEHTFDETDSPVMNHKVGYCSVMKEVAELEYPLIEGAIQVTEENRSFRVSSTDPVRTFGSFDHEYLYGGDQPESHTQYLRKAEDRGISILSIGDLRGLKSSPPGTPSTREQDKIMSQGEHGLPPSGMAAQHKDGSISLISFMNGLKIPIRCLKRGSNVVTVTGDGSYSMSINDDHIFMPIHGDLAAYYSVNPINSNPGQINLTVVDYVSDFSLRGRYIAP